MRDKDVDDKAMRFWKPSNYAIAVIRKTRDYESKGVTLYADFCEGVALAESFSLSIDAFCVHSHYITIVIYLLNGSLVSNKIFALIIEIGARSLLSS